jgi:hypothetical protein
MRSYITASVALAACLSVSPVADPAPLAPVDVRIEAMALPPGHPPIDLVLPPGHPPIGRLLELPPGHPPIGACPAARFVHPAVDDEADVIPIPPATVARARPAPLAL